MLSRAALRLMFRPTSNSNRSQAPCAWLRRADQTVVAGAVLVAIASVGIYWFAQGGSSGRLIEIDRAQPLEAQYQVDVNSADWPELAQAPGLGETLARRIVAERRAHGPYRDHQDLLRVKGIGPKTLDRMRPYLAPLAGDGAVAGR